MVLRKTKATTLYLLTAYILSRDERVDARRSRAYISRGRGQGRFRGGAKTAKTAKTDKSERRAINAKWDQFDSNDQLESSEDGLESDKPVNEQHDVKWIEITIISGDDEEASHDDSIGHAMETKLDTVTPPKQSSEELSDAPSDKLSMQPSFAPSDVASNQSSKQLSDAPSDAAELSAGSIEAILSQQLNINMISQIEAPSAMLVRLEPSSLSDDISIEEVNSLRPNPRDISNAFHVNATLNIPNSYGASDWLWAFGQFLNHDIGQVNVNKGDFCNISVSPNDPVLHNVTFIPMSRSKSQLDSNDVAQQLSEMTSLIDAENVYGTTNTRLAYLLAPDANVTGRLRTSGNDLLPKNAIGLTNRGGDDRDDLFLAGDPRANENLALTVTHNLWLREHNYWADAIRAIRPELNGESVFEIARVMVRAIMQKITYDEFLPALIGKGSIPEYAGYKEDVDTGLENIVSSCAYRMGHTMVGETLATDYGNGDVVHLPLVDAFFAPQHMEQNGLDPFLRGMASNTCQEVDPLLVPALRNHLFAKQFDLMALNIERGRDHGLPDFNSIRASVGYPKLENFDDFLFTQELSSVYNSTDDIDCFIGMHSEPRLAGLMVGPTQQAVLARNFANIRDGDEHFYLNSIQDDDLLELIEGTTFADVIKRNSDALGSLDDIGGDVFFVHGGI